MNMRLKTVGRRCAMAVVAWLLGCGTGSPVLVTEPAPEPGLEDVEVALYLIGDAGAPEPDDQVLAALEADIGRHPERSTVVFLGDNIYPKGLPDSAAPNRAESERRLQEQIDAVLDAGGRAVFVPGNHDWVRGGAEGWNAIRRQQAYIEAQGTPDVVLLPRGGCPGPDVVDLGARLRVVLVDTQWWLHKHAKPEPPTSTCGADSYGEVTDSLRAVIRSAGDRYVAVMAHHPLASGGKHGGHFSILEHIFPLRELKSWLWLPLPIIGSAYPVARMSGISSQDIPSGAYQEMRDSLHAAFAEGPPLIYAGGHEHNLQVLDGEVVEHMLVSGGGYYDHRDRAVYLEQTRFASPAGGFMRVDVLRDGRARLAVFTVDEEAHATEAFTMWLHTVGGSME
jgi:hypothetical protein